MDSIIHGWFRHRCLDSFEKESEMDSHSWLGSFVPHIVNFSVNSPLTKAILQGMQLFHFIFLSRSWASDRSELTGKLAQTAIRARSFGTPLALLIYPEGTLVSADTRPISRKYAEKINAVCLISFTLCFPSLILTLHRMTLSTCCFPGPRVYSTASELWPLKHLN